MGSFLWEKPDVGSVSGILWDACDVDFRITNEISKSLATLRLGARPPLREPTRIRDDPLNSLQTRECQKTTADA